MDIKKLWELTSMTTIVENKTFLADKVIHTLAGITATNLPNLKVIRTSTRI